MSLILRALLAVLICTSLARADVVLPHSGYLLGATDVPAEGTVAMRFRLYDAPTGGSLKWTGDAGLGAACAVAVRQGYYAVVLGGTGSASCGTTLSGSGLAEGLDRWLEVEAGNVALLPRIAITPLPAARTSLDTQALITTLGTQGTLNQAGNPVHWTQLTGVTAGTGLELAAGTFAVAAQGISASRVGSGATPAARALVADGAGGALWSRLTSAAIDSGAQPASRLLASDGAGGATWAQVTNAAIAPGTITADRLNGYNSGTGVVAGLDANYLQGKTVTDIVTLAQAGSVSLSVLAGIQRPCNAGAGTQTFDGTAWGSCSTNQWNCAITPTHAGCVSSSQYTSCLAIRNDATFNGANGSYYIDPDGTGLADAPVLVYCDMASQGGGWTRVASLPASDGTDHRTTAAITGNGKWKLADATINRIGFSRIMVYPGDCGTHYGDFAETVWQSTGAGNAGRVGGAAQVRQKSNDAAVYSFNCGGTTDLNHVGNTCWQASPNIHFMWSHNSSVTVNYGQGTYNADCATTRTVWWLVR